MRMSAERLRVLEPLLDRALDLPGAEREAFLADLAAREPELAADLREMLSRESEVERERFLENGAPREAVRTGETLGAYTLETLIGEGGMGTIWLAHRSDGTYESDVAIKLVRAGL